ncbi:MAG TPA: glycosyl hydrolase, partial [Gemmatimonadota bacterium]|nr:glycosyl hydrolase [Gemmatimonadota bacterium]
MRRKGSTLHDPVDVSAFPDRAPGRALVAAACAAVVAIGLAAAPAASAAQESRAAGRSPHPPGQVVLDTALYAGLRYRSIGPTRGGRATAVSGVPGKPNTFYLGATGGGVWKSDDAGNTWSNVSDGFFSVGSIGAITVAPSDPDVVYVGTGSSEIRGNVSTGKGLYRSDDGGKSWRFLGLEDGGAIGDIRVSPRDPDLVYAAVIGHPFGPNATRGVYRSRDGGKSWDKVLFVSDSTGFTDLAMDPTNPRVLYAAAWRVERKPWTIISGAKEGGIWKTTDGGDHWRKLGGGLPDGLVGKASVTVSPADPDRVWALIEAAPVEKSGVYRSDDAGETWRLTTNAHKLTQRAFYYMHVFADPQDPNTVYALNTSMYRSIDGGKTFDRIRVPHGDTHDLWINPDRPDHIIIGDDGGGQVTVNGGRTWTSYYNQPTAQFYRVFVDNRFPYRVYGPQQDNTTISVPAWAPGTGELTSQGLWRTQGGGESGYIAFDPEHPGLTYAGSYGGVIDRMDHESGQSRDVVPYPQLALGESANYLKYRFQWNAPILKSRFDTSVVYTAAQVVLKTTDGGHGWTPISPDLTRNDTTKGVLAGEPINHEETGVEIYGTVFALAEGNSADVLWAGSDDGLVHLTRDGGKSWKDVTPP